MANWGQVSSRSLPNPGQHCHGRNGRARRRVWKFITGKASWCCRSRCSQALWDGLRHICFRNVLPSEGTVCLIYPQLKKSSRWQREMFYALELGEVSQRKFVRGSLWESPPRNGPERTSWKRPHLAARLRPSVDALRKISTCATFSQERYLSEVENDAYFMAFGVIRFAHLQRSTLMKADTIAMYFWCARGKQKGMREGFYWSSPRHTLSGFDLLPAMSGCRVVEISDDRGPAAGPLPALPAELTFMHRLLPKGWLLTQLILAGFHGNLYH